MIRTLLVLLVCLLTGIIYGQNKEKFQPKLLQQFQETERVRTIIILNRQFDVSKAKEKNGKFEKGAYVFYNLTKVARETQGHIIDFLSRENIVFKPFYLANAVYAELDEKSLLEIADFPEVKYIIEDHEIDLDELHTFSGAAHTRARIEWGISRIKADSVWTEYDVKGDGIVVGGQDTGYEWGHPALKEQYRGWNSETGTADHKYNWFDAVDALVNGEENPCGLESSEPCDDHGHGSHTMGVSIGYDGMNNHIGTAPHAKWIGARNMERGKGYFSWAMTCFEWFCAPYKMGENPDNGDPFYAPDIINNSWGIIYKEREHRETYSLVKTLIQNLRSSGIAVVAANGNEGDGGQCYSTVRIPAICDEAFSIGNTTQDDTLYKTSSIGPVFNDGPERIKPDMVAPGTGIRSANNNSGYGRGTGTSLSSPHVVGAMALLISAVPSLSGEVAEIETILKESATPLCDEQPCGNLSPQDVPNNEYGYGLVNALKAVEMALEALPLRLLKFTGHAEKDYNLLEWKTSDEINFSHFNVQRTSDGREWENIATVKSKTISELSVGNYSAMDENPMYGKNYYRLKQIDKDGKAIYSSTILIYWTEQEPLPNIKIYPNPTRNKLMLSGYDKQIEYTVYSSLGVKMLSGVITDNTLDVSTIPDGIYFIELKIDKQLRSMKFYKSG